MSSYILDLMTETFRACGAPEPERLAKEALKALDKAKVIDQRKAYCAERGAKIYDLRVHGVSVESVAVRFRISSRQVVRATKIEILRRRGK